MPSSHHSENRASEAEISLNSTQADSLRECSCSELRDENKICHPRAIRGLLGSGGLRHGGHVYGAASSRVSPDSRDIDAEEGSMCSEHVILKFAGSNCPGCTSKISKALESVSSVYNLQMNTMLLRAEFDLDLTKSSIRDVMESVRSTTGRACERIGDGWQELDVVGLSVSRKFADSMLPAGVKDVTELSQDTFSVKYDAKVIGARHLLKALNAVLDGSVSLAPAKAHDEVPADIRKAAYMTMLSSVITVPILVLAWAPLPEHKTIYGALSLAFATVIQVVIAGPFYPRALRSLILTRVIDMDLLIVLSTSITYGFSVASFICQTKGTNLASEVYFETSTLLITLIMVGRLIGDFACHRAMKSTSIISFQQQFAFVVDTSDPYTDDGLEVDVRLLQYGDVFRVKPGCVVVTDGIIVSGASEFDESIMTGEASLVEKFVGSAVIAGSVNHCATVLVQLTRLPGENIIDEIAGMVEQVMHSKPKIQQTADRVAAWIVPAAGILAILTLVIWFVVAKSARKESATSAVLNAIPYAISVLIVSCPCAIGMAVPIVLMVASAVGVKHGVIFRSAEAMRVARGATHIVFDSTGTLTEGCLSVLTEEYFSGSQQLTGALALALTSHSEHPVSSAVATYLEAAGFKPALVADCTSVIGKGVEASWNGEIVRVGNAHWLGVETLAPVQSLLSRNLTVSCVSRGGRLLAAFGLESPLRDDASAVVAKLVERGIAVSIMSGNETGAVQKIATELGIPHEDVKAKCTPLEKQEHVKELMQTGNNTVIFCGDGINDEAALAQANVGLRINNGTRVMRNAGNAVLTGPSLSGILVLIDLSRHCHRQIVFNFTWAVFYNVFAILLAAGAFIKIRLSPEYAGLGEAVSVLPVIFVPMHLRWRKYL